MSNCQLHDWPGVDSQDKTRQLLPVGAQDQVYLRVLCSGGAAAARGGEAGGSSTPPEVCGWGDPLNGPLAEAAQGDNHEMVHLWKGAGCIWPHRAESTGPEGEKEMSIQPTGALVVIWELMHCYRSEYSVKSQ